MSQPSSHDSGVFQVPPAAAPQQEVRVPGATTSPTSTPASQELPRPPAAAPQPVEAPESKPSIAADGLTLGRASVSEVRVPKFDPPKPASPAPLPPKRAAETPAPPATMRVELPRSVERKMPVAAPGAAVPIPEAIRVELPAAGRVLPLFASGKSLRVSARKLEFPTACPCCGVPADSSFDAQHVRKRGKRVVRSETYAWTFPYCRVCLEHVRRTRGIHAYSGGAGIVALAACAGLGFAVGQLVIGAVVGLVAGGAAYWFVRRHRLTAASRDARGSCACAGPAVRYNGFHGTVHEFEFASPTYAEAFAQENERKVL